MRHDARCRFRVCLPLVLLALCAVACQPPGTVAAPPPSSPGTGSLTGLVTRGPMSSVERPGIANTTAAVGIELVIRKSDGTPAATVRTDAQGAYRVTLPPGTYEVRAGQLSGMDFTKSLPATITIVAGQETRLDVRIDSGVR